MGWFDRLSPQTQSLIEPIFLYSAALSVYLQTLWNEIKSLRIPVPSKVRDKAFSDFWNEFTKPLLKSTDPPVRSQALIPPLLSEATGLVLDVGPGTGVTTKYYRNATGATKIYGAEPNTSLHATLTETINTAGLTGKYQIITADASAASVVRALEAAAKMDSSDGPKSGFDTIVCVRVLCSVPDPKQTIHDLHTLLKPGGKLMVVEHVINPWRTGQGSLAGRLAQTFYMMIGWAYFVGGCEMTRDTKRTLVAAAGRKGWADVKLETHFAWGPFTYIAGSLTKA